MHMNPGPVVHVHYDDTDTDTETETEKYAQVTIHVNRKQRVPANANRASEMRQTRSKHAENAPPPTATTSNTKSSIGTRTPEARLPTPPQETESYIPHNAVGDHPSLESQSTKAIRPLTDITCLPFYFIPKALTSPYRSFGKQPTDFPPLMAWAVMDTVTGEILTFSTYRTLFEANGLMPAKLCCQFLKRFQKVPNTIRYVGAGEESYIGFQDFQRFLEIAMKEMDLKPPAVWYYNDIANVFEFLSRRIIKLISENTTLNGMAAAKIYIGLCSNRLGWNAQDSVKIETFYFVWGRVTRDIFSLQVDNWNHGASLLPEWSNRDMSQSSGELPASSDPDHLYSEDTEILVEYLESKLEMGTEQLRIVKGATTRIRSALDESWAHSFFMPITLETAWDMFTQLETRARKIMGLRPVASPPTETSEIAELIRSSCSRLEVWEEKED